MRVVMTSWWAMVGQSRESRHYFLFRTEPRLCQDIDVWIDASQCLWARSRPFPGLAHWGLCLACNLQCLLLSRWMLCDAVFCVMPHSFHTHPVSRSSSHHARDDATEGGHRRLGTGWAGHRQLALPRCPPALRRHGARVGTAIARVHRVHHVDDANKTPSRAPLCLSTPPLSLSRAPGSRRRTASTCPCAPSPAATTVISRRSTTT